MATFGRPMISHATGGAETGSLIQFTSTLKDNFKSFPRHYEPLELTVLYFGDFVNWLQINIRQQLQV